MNMRNPYVFPFLQPGSIMDKLSCVLLLKCLSYTVHPVLVIAPTKVSNRTFVFQTAITTFLKFPSTIVWLCVEIISVARLYCKAMFTFSTSFLFFASENHAYVKIGEEFMKISWKQLIDMSQAVSISYGIPSYYCLRL